jgi:hypothetical protein
MAHLLSQFLSYRAGMDRISIRGSGAISLIARFQKQLQPLSPMVDYVHKSAPSGLDITLITFPFQIPAGESLYGVPGS